MMRYIVGIIIMVLGLQSVRAQGRQGVDYSSVQLDSLLSSYEKVNSGLSHIDGYRIQIYSGSGAKAKSEAQSAKSRFATSFPQERVYVVYNAPFWRVRVGDFRFRSEALPLLEKMKKQFPGSYTVRDNTVKKKSFK